MSGARRRCVQAGAALVLVGAAALTGQAAVAAPATGEVYVVHGVPGTPLSVALDGRPLATAAAPKTVVGPVTLPAGPHVVELSADGRPVTSARFTVAAGRSIDLVASRGADAARTPRVVVFRNDLSAVGPGRARLVVAHAASAPPADVRVDGSVLFHDVAPGEALSLLLPARSYSVDVVTSVGGTPVLAPVALEVRAGTLTRVFAVGDPASGTADAVVQVLPVGTSGAGRPTRVPTGDGGQAADEFTRDGGPLSPGVAVVGLAALLLLLRGRLVRAGRRVPALWPRRRG